MVDRQKNDLFQFSGRGEVYSFTIIKDNAPTGFETPYAVSIIRLNEGNLISAQLTDSPDPLNPGKGISIGMPVEMVTRKLTQDGDKGLIVYGYKFRQLINKT